jgi:hypothetical protein
MKSELLRIWKENVVTTLFWHSPGMNEENHEVPNRVAN